MSSKRTPKSPLFSSLAAPIELPEPKQVPTWSPRNRQVALGGSFGDPGGSFWTLWGSFWTDVGAFYSGFGGLGSTVGCFWLHVFGIAVTHSNNLPTRIIIEYTTALSMVSNPNIPTQTHRPTFSSKKQRPNKAISHKRPGGLRGAIE